MASTVKKEFKSPDDIRNFEKGKVEVVKINGGTVGRFTLEPGWRWSEHVRPIAGTEWCEAPHFQYIESGRVHIHTKEGQDFEAGPGDVIFLRPGHDGWVVGDEPVIAIDWTGAGEYAKEKR